MRTENHPHRKGDCACRPSAACAYCPRLTGVLSEPARAGPPPEELTVPTEVVDAALALFSARTVKGGLPRG